MMNCKVGSGQGGAWRGRRTSAEFRVFVLRFRIPYSVRRKAGVRCCMGRRAPVNTEHATRNGPRRWYLVICLLISDAVFGTLRSTTHPMRVELLLAWPWPLPTVLTWASCHWQVAPTDATLCQPNSWNLICPPRFGVADLECNRSNDSMSYAKNCSETPDPHETSPRFFRLVVCTFGRGLSHPGRPGRLGRFRRLHQ